MELRARPTLFTPSLLDLFLKNRWLGKHQLKESQQRPPHLPSFLHDSSRSFFHRGGSVIIVHLDLVPCFQAGPSRSSRTPATIARCSNNVATRNKPSWRCVNLSLPSSSSPARRARSFAKTTYSSSMASTAQNKIDLQCRAVQRLSGRHLGRPVSIRHCTF